MNQVTRPVAQSAIPSHLTPAARPKPGAEEQFIAENAWANPQHHQSQYLINIHRQVSNGLRQESPVNTPAGQKIPTEPIPNGSASTIAAPPTSSIGPTPMSAETGPAKSRHEGTFADYTPSKAPARDDPLGGPDAKTMMASDNGSADTKHHSVSASRETGVNDAAADQRAGPTPSLMGSQSLKDAPQDGRLPGQFAQGAGPPPVKVGTV